MQNSKGMTMTGWILTAIPALMLAAGGVMGLFHPPEMAKGFEHLGWPDRMAPILGVIELTCAVLYIFPRTAVLGAILITGYLGGATATHVRIGESTWFIPVLVGVVAWGGLFFRDARIRALIPWNEKQ